MTKSVLNIVGFILVHILGFQPVFPQLNILAIDVSGDSISKGFNAGSASPCTDADQEIFNWLTSDTHGALFSILGSCDHPGFES